MLLHVDTLRKSFPSDAGPVSVLKGVSFDLAAGETLALRGESGSGKSTVLHLIAGLEQGEAGEITLDGQRVSGASDQDCAEMRRDKIGLIFQQFNLIPSLSVAQNLSFQARLAGRHDPDWCARLSDKLGLDALLSRYPEALSGGQQQRVAIGRALAARPRLILADEPTGNLDEITADAVMALMLDLVGESDAALIMVTHSHRLAGMLARSVTLKHGVLV